ncbi:MAG: bifunctional heptose 7-phosphate kinase/heptose 1-phosphate adenyltransferase [Phycisphaerae bacterium]
MNVARLSQERLADLLRRFPEQRIAVLGDFFLDKYLDVDPRIADVSVESGKTAHQVVNVRVSPGAAGTVMINLASLEAGELHAIGLTGDDGEGYDLRKCLTGLGCTTTHLHMSSDRHTPQYLKPRDCTDPSLSGEHERYDTKNRTPTPRDLEQKIMASIDALLPDVDAIAIMDQVEMDGCGVVTRAVREMLADRAKKHPKVVFWADSRRRIRLFRNVIIKANQFEAVGRETWLPEDEVPLAELRAAVEALRAQNGVPVFTTLGARGMMVSDPWTHVPGVRLDGEIDITGAGDSCSAGAVLALCAGATPPEAAVVGNLVASITVQQLGTTGVARREQLPDRLALWQRQQEESGP